MKNSYDFHILSGFPDKRRFLPKIPVATAYREIAVHIPVVSLNVVIINQLHARMYNWSHWT